MRASNAARTVSGRNMICMVEAMNSWLARHSSNGDGMFSSAAWTSSWTS